MVRRRKGSRGASNPTGSGSPSAKLSVKNADENVQKNKDTQEGNESVKDVADDQRKGMDTVAIATEAKPSAIVNKDQVFKVVEDSEKATSDTPEATYLTAKEDKDEIIKVVEDSGKATSDTPEATYLTAKEDEDEIIKVGKVSEKSPSDTPETSLITKVDKDEIIKVVKDSEKATSDNKAAEKSVRNKSPRKELIELETKVSSLPTTGVQKLDNPASADSKEPEELVAKRRLLPAGAFSACVPPILYDKDTLCLNVESLQASKLKDIDERKRTFDSKDLKTQQELSPDNERTLTNPKTEVNVSMSPLPYSKDNVEQEHNLNLEASNSQLIDEVKSILKDEEALKAQQELLSEIERTLIEAEFEVSVPKIVLTQFKNFIEEQNFDLKASKPQQQLSSENEGTATAIQFEENQSAIWEQGFKDAIEVVQKLEKMQPELSLEKEKTETIAGVGQSFLQLQDPKLMDIDEKLLNLDLNASKVEQDPSSEDQSELNEPQKLDLKYIKMQPELSRENDKTETITEVGQSKPLLQDPKLMDIDENLLNLDLNASKVEQDPSSEDQSELNEPQTKTYEKIINLERDVNLSFEFDKHGTKRFLVNDEVHYVGDEKQKVTFNLGVGNAQLSFIGNKVSISAQEGKIDCSMQRNRVIFSLTDSAIKPEPLSEGQRGTQIQRRLEDSFETFLTNVRTTCEDFKNSFLKSLKE